MSDKSILDMDQESIRDLEASMPDDQIKYKDSDPDIMFTVYARSSLCRWPANVKVVPIHTVPGSPKRLHFFTRSTMSCTVSQFIYRSGPSIENGGTYQPLSGSRSKAGRR